MAIQAKLKDDVTMKSIVACGGIVFYKDWQDVPFWEEKAAKNNPYLDTRELVKEVQTKVEEPVKEEIPIIKAETPVEEVTIEEPQEISLKEEKKPAGKKSKGQKAVDEISFEDLTK